MRNRINYTRTIWRIESIAPGQHEEKDEFILFFKSSWCKIADAARNFNQFCPPNSSDDFCLLFCLYPSSMMQCIKWAKGSESGMHRLLVCRLFRRNCSGQSWKELATYPAGYPTFSNARIFSRRPDNRCTKRGIVSARCIAPLTLCRVGLLG